MGIYIRKPGAYPAVVSRIGAIFEVRFVDFPNCVAAGKNAEEAENNARFALGVYISTLSRFHRLPPVPTANLEGNRNTLDRYVTYLESILPPPCPPPDIERPQVLLPVTDA